MKKNVHCFIDIDFLYLEQLGQSGIIFTAFKKSGAEGEAGQKLIFWGAYF